ncbi:MAG: asparagine synthase-related protein [Bacteroidetes bacterium]|nr:asparagine synthase-related protein [Bacteroidota bacterium]
MSTIFGIIDKSGEGFDRQWLELMNADLAHGAPDRSGLWQNENAGLGNLQVFNTPESLAEILPMESLERVLTICSDSRIDNRDQIAGRLSISPHDLKTTPDSSLILKAYQKWGTACCTYLRGDFAFGIYDVRNRQFILARDHFGMRPIFYFDHPRFFIFSSELRGILALPFFEKELNSVWFLDYLINVEREENDTFYQGIFSLPPGNQIVVKSGIMTIQKYWELSIPDRIVLKNDGEYIEGYKALFENSVKNRTRSAFPVGAELSGGLDSSSIAAIAQKKLTAQGNQLHVFARVLPEQVNSALDDDGKDETAEIEMVCNFCGIQNIHQITLEDEKIVENIGQNIEVVRSPFYSNYAVYNLNAHHVAKSIGVRTMLSGHGGDQMVTNPAHFVYQDYMRKFRYLKLFRDIRAKDTMHDLEFVKSLRYFFNLRRNKNDFINKRREIKKLFKFGINPDFLVQNHLEERYLQNRQHAMLLPENGSDLILKITHRHMNDRIEATSIMAGHDGIEFRYPMYDVDLIEYYLAVPDEIKRKFRSGRYLHRMAMQDELPPPIQWRRDKNGTINPGLARIFTNEALKVKSDLSRYSEAHQNSTALIFDPTMIGYLVADDSNNLYKYKSLINKFFQLQNFEKIIEKKFG